MSARRLLRADGRRRRAKVQSAYGYTTSEPGGADQFRVRFTPTLLPDGAGSTVLHAEALVVEQPRSFTARRLAGQRLEFCEGERCVTLERHLDPFDYDVR